MLLFNGFHLLGLKLSEGGCGTGVKWTAADDALLDEGLVGRALSAEGEVLGKLRLPEGDGESAAETWLEELLKLLPIILLVAVIAELHAVLQLEVTIWPKFEPAVDAII
jgi:hypothetical protein